MYKKILIVILTLVGLVIVAYVFITTKGNKEPVAMKSNASLIKMTIDDKIEEAELIVIGQVRTTLPSKWKGQNQKKAEDATPEEISRREGGGLFTDSLILIDQVLKGSYKEPIVRVRTFIGETSQVHWENSSEPIYEKGKVYLLFLEQDFGPTQIVDPGDYISVNSGTAVYEIIDGKAISLDDEWTLEDLVNYIRESPLSVSPVLPDTPEAKEITQRIKTAYDIEAEAAYSFDLAKFPSIFINDPRYEIDQDKLDFVRDATNNPSLESAGYLDYKTIYYTWWQEGVTRFEALREKAIAENRNITDDEINAFIASKWGTIPGHVNDSKRYIKLKFISMNINDDVATVILDDGPRINTELTLVLVDGQWYIAGCQWNGVSSIKFSC